MSEREKTEALKELIEYGLCGVDRLRVAAYDRAEKAVHADPDLVGVLRKMEEIFNERFLEAEGASVIVEMEDYIQKTVRLTDQPPGWEWTKEEGE